MNGMWFTATARRLDHFLGIDAEDEEHAPVDDSRPPRFESTRLYDDAAEPCAAGVATKARTRLQPCAGPTSNAELIVLRDLINELRDGLGVDSSS